MVRIRQITYRHNTHTHTHTVDADDKWLVKKELEKLSYPIAPGKSFSFFSKKGAAAFANSMGFPVVIKPRRGSLTQHMYIVKDNSTLFPAIKNVCKYSPLLIIEKFIPNALLFRITIIDYDKIFVVKRSPPFIIGDGKSTLNELIRHSGLGKNLSPEIIMDQKMILSSIPAAGIKIFLHNKILRALDAKIEEVSLDKIHKNILNMCQHIARHFELPIVGIDLLIEDMQKPWPNQNSAILELNTVPDISIHTFDRAGRKENKAVDALVDFVLKHY